MHPMTPGSFWNGTRHGFAPMSCAQNPIQIYLVWVCVSLARSGFTGTHIKKEEEMKNQVAKLMLHILKSSQDQ